MRAAAAFVLVVGQTATLAQSDSRRPAVPPEVTALLARPHLLYRHTGAGPNYSTLSVTALEAPGARRASTSTACDRVAFARGAGICLQTDRKLFAGYKAVLFDAALVPGRSFKLPGSPSRAKVSADGRVGAFTVFVAGHSYAVGGFSTETQLVDMTQGDLIGNLEEFSAWKSGARITAADVNYWGVTFKTDRNTFYATLATARTAHLAVGDLGLRKMTVVADNVECPSLSPDNRRLAFKRRVGPGSAWRIYVMDLATMKERPVEGETRYVDDQVEWLDDAHLLYGLRRNGTAVADIWVAGVDDAAPARVFLSEAESPVVVR